jgi:hypothetical protein
MACMCVVLIAAVTAAQAPPPTGNAVTMAAGLPKAVAGTLIQGDGGYTEGAGPPKWTCSDISLVAWRTVIRNGSSLVLTNSVQVLPGGQNNVVPNPWGPIDVGGSPAGTTWKVRAKAAFFRVVSPAPGTIVTEYDSAMTGTTSVTTVP